MYTHIHIIRKNRYLLKYKFKNKMLGIILSSRKFKNKLYDYHIRIVYCFYHNTQFKIGLLHSY